MSIGFYDTLDQGTFDSRDIIALYASLPKRVKKDDKEEFDDLEAFICEASGALSDWDYGVTFISDDSFEAYARELADELGLKKPGMEWPYTCIDWEAAADELQQDYTFFDWGVGFWARD